MAIEQLSDTLVIVGISAKIVIKSYRIIVHGPYQIVAVKPNSVETNVGLSQLP